MDNATFLHRELCATIGLVVTVWAHAENTLAGAIAIIDEEAGPLPGHPGLPVSLKKRVAYLKLAARTVARIHVLKDEARALAERFVLLKEGRHELVHGAGWQISEGVFQNLRLVVEGRQATSQQRFVTIGDAVAFAVEVEGLADQATAFLASVIAIYEN